MDFRLAIEGGKEDASSALSGGARAAMAAMVPACKKRRLETMGISIRNRQHLAAVQVRLAIIGGLPFPIGNCHLKIENEPVMEAGFQCAGCGEWNQTTVDESAGRSQ